MDFTQYSLELLAFLFVISIIAGLLDTLAGGGGLISIPALIVSGIPPLAALGTNKLQGCMGTATATYMLVKNKRISLRDNKSLIATAFAGALLGTIAVQFINTDILSFVIPLVLVCIALYFLMAPTAKPSESKMSDKRYQNTVVPAIGAYDGMFGPGTGSFFALAGVTCKGFSLIEATARAKALNFATNAASFIIFLAAGQIVWVVGLLMMVGQLIGASLGAHFLYRINPAYLRVIIVVMCVSMLIRYSMSMGWI